MILLIMMLALIMNDDHGQYDKDDKDSDDDEDDYDDDSANHTSNQTYNR